MLRISASPVAIPTEGTAALTADLVVNSDEVDTSASGHIPDGIGVAFSGTLGNVTPTAVGTTGGIAMATFTAGTVAGTAVVSATVDNQTVSTTIDINAPTVSANAIYLPIILK